MPSWWLVAGQFFADGTCIRGAAFEFLHQDFVCDSQCPRVNCKLRHPHRSRTPPSGVVGLVAIKGAAPAVGMYVCPQCTLENTYEANAAGCAACGLPAQFPMATAATAATATTSTAMSSSGFPAVPSALTVTAAAFVPKPSYAIVQRNDETHSTLLRVRPSFDLDDSVWTQPFTDVVNGDVVLVHMHSGDFDLIETDGHVRGYVRSVHLQPLLDASPLAVSSPTMRPSFLPQRDALFRDQILRVFQSPALQESPQFVQAASSHPRGYVPLELLISLDSILATMCCAPSNLPEMARTLCQNLAKSTQVNALMQGVFAACVCVFMCHKLMN